jgi:ankyrin repeat protein
MIPGASVFTLLLTTLALSTSASASVSAEPLGPPSAEQELRNIATRRNPRPEDYDRLLLLLSQGASPDARDASGASATLLAVESHAYISGGGNAQLIQLSSRIARKLLEAAKHPGRGDRRGYLPAQYLLAYGNPEADGEVFDALLARNPDLSAIDPVLGRGVVHQLAGGSHPRILARILARPGHYQLRFDALAPSTRQNVLHFAARTRAKDAGGRPLLEVFTELLPKELRKRYANAQDATGVTPLMVAARAGNVEALRYLLDTAGASVAPVSLEGDNALSLAIQSGRPEAAALLRERGATEPATQPADVWYCDRANEKPFTFDTLRELVDVRCRSRIRSIDDLLPLLPSRLRGNYVLIHHGRGIQVATFKDPRAVLFTPDGALILGFIGDKSQPGYASLEIARFDRARKAFEYREVDFSLPTPAAGTRFSEANPAKCLRCHTQDPRPNWDRWSLWPGLYEGDMGSRYAERERKGYASYLQRKESVLHPSRYRHLLPQSLSPVETFLGKVQSGVNFANVKFDSLIMALMGEKVARALRDQPALHRYRYALLGALSCREPVESFLPPGVQAALPRKPAELAQESTALALEEYRIREDFFASALGSRPVGRYNMEYLNVPGDDGPFTGGAFDIDRVAALRYLVEGVLGAGKDPMRGWFNTFLGDEATSARRPTFYVTPFLTPVEAAAWKELLDPAADAELWGIYEKESVKLAGSDPFFWIYGAQYPSAQALCAKLKAKSLAELGAAP